MIPLKVSPILPALILAACTAAPAPPLLPAVAPPSWGQGIDLPTDSSDVLNELKSNRVDFVARYYRNPDSRWPALSPVEAQRRSANGIKIVAVWEAHSRDPAYFSYSQGYGDAITASGEARAIGQPPGTAIYFAVDFNAQWLMPIDEYFRGIAAGLAAANGGRAGYAVGVYGSGMVCDSLKRSGLARYCWLSNAFAWDGSTAYEDWNIRQGEPSAALSFNQDSDEARNDYGAFRVADSGGATASVAGQFSAPPAPQVAGTGVALRAAAGEVTTAAAPQVADAGVVPRAAAAEVTAAPPPRVADSGATRSPPGAFIAPPTVDYQQALVFADVPLGDAEADLPAEATRRHTHRHSAVARAPYLRVQYASAAGKTLWHRVASATPSSASAVARHKAKCGVARCASSAASSR